jgi:hypothetical protein
MMWLDTFLNAERAENRSQMVLIVTKIDPVAIRNATKTIADHYNIPTQVAYFTVIPADKYVWFPVLDKMLAKVRHPDPMTEIDDNPEKLN